MGRRTLLLSFALGGAALSSGLWIASAQQVVVSGKATDLAAERKALREAKIQAERARTLSRQMDVKAKSATAEADRLNAQAAALAARITESEAELRASEARLAIANRLVADQSARLAAQQGPLVRLTAALQSLSHRPPAFMLMQPGSLVDMVHVRAAFGHIWPAVHRRTASLRNELGHSRQLRAIATQAGDGLRASRTQLADRKAEFNRLEQEQRVAAQGFTAGASLESERATAMEERARDIDELMSRVGQAGEIRTRLSALPAPPPRPQPAGQQGAAIKQPTPPPAYILPASGTIITGTGEISESGLRSRGITIAVKPGASIIAPAAGQIAFSGPYKGFKQIVIIDHGAGWTTLITDFSRLSVRKGDKVEQGDDLGTAQQGNSPAITTELRRQGRPIDIITLATPL
ncbi:MAG: metalloendopeptidase [Sphingobium sp.]|nr:metalloendopeptidase [Sphingobium sp.]